MLRIETSVKFCLVPACFLLFFTAFSDPCLSKQYSKPVSNLLIQGDKLLLEKGQIDEARKYYEKALSIDPDCPHAHNQLGNCYRRQGMLLEAIGHYKKALTIDPNFVASLSNLGTTLYLQGDYDTSIKCYEKLLSLKKNADADTLANLANVYRDRATFSDTSNREDDYDRAIELYKKAITLKPAHSQAHNNLGLCYFRLKHYDDAEAEINKALDYKRDYPQAYFNLGLVMQAKKQLPDALQAYQSSLRYETDPAYIESTRKKIKELGISTVTTDSASDHFAQGYDYLRRKEWEDAAAQLKIAVNNANNKDAIAWNNYGFALSKLNKDKEAEEAYRKAISLMPSQFPAASYNLGVLLFESGNYAASEKAFRKAINDAGGTHALAQNALALTLKKSNAAEAMSHYKLAIMQSGDTLPVVHFNIGLLLEKQGKNKEAKQEYETYLSKSPSGYNADAARKRLTYLSSISK